MKPKARTKSTKLSPAAQKARKVEKKSADSDKTIISICQRSRAALTEGDLQLAHDLAFRACEILPKDSTNVDPIELFGEINIELGELGAAFECFSEAVRRRENVSPGSYELGEEGKFLWLGQMSSGDDSERWFLRGIGTLENILGKTTDETQRKHVSERLCNCYCSLIEIFLTDLWWDLLVSH